MSTAKAEPFQTPSLRKALVRLGLGLLVFLVAIAALGTLLRDPIAAVGGWFVQELGYTGLALGFLFFDMVPVGTHDAVMLAALTGGMPIVPATLVGMAATFFAIVADWVIGRALGHNVPLLRRLIERWRIPEFMDHYGTRAVIILAIIPIPWAPVGWFLGMSKEPLPRILLAATIRALKVILSVVIIAAGWSVGG